MGFQFVHLETYSRKGDKSGRSVSWVLDEASREPGACPHVEDPCPPEVVHGVGLDEVRRLHDDAAAAATTTLRNGRERAVRTDQKTLMTVIASHPATMDGVRSDAATAAAVADWERRTVDWLRAQYGDELVSVIRHTDEAHPHLHAYVIPGDVRAQRFHPGAEAKRQVVAAGPDGGEDRKALNKRGDQAYRQAMREWQDSYWQHVGLPCGLARLGPRRRRLSREEWQAEKSAVSAVRAAEERAAAADRRARALAGRGREYVERTKAQVAAARAAAAEQMRAARAAHDAAVQQERRARDMITRAKGQARRILSSARAEAERWSGWGERLRSFVDGFQVSRIRQKEQARLAPELERERERAQAEVRRAEEERQRRRTAEERAAEAMQSARDLGAERDRLRERVAGPRSRRPAPRT